jgi:hypothetical protein
MYNCFAWAAGLDDRLWGIDKGCGEYWPDGVPRNQSVAAYVEAYRTLGFERCATPDLEEGLEKLAIYVADSGEPQHAARQLASGFWTSKMGWILEDIEHDSLACLEGEEYGTVKAFLARPRAK